MYITQVEAEHRESVMMRMAKGYIRTSEISIPSLEALQAKPYKSGLSDDEEEDDDLLDEGFMETFRLNRLKEMAAQVLTLCLTCYQHSTEQHQAILTLTITRPVTV